MSLSATSRERRQLPASLDAATDHEHQTALRLLLQAPDELDRRIALPTLATAGDVREVVQYLKKKPGGVSVVEALDDVKKRVFEARKIAAYEFWGLVKRSPGGDRLMLSPLGWEFASRLEPEAEAYRTVLKSIEPYHTALCWMNQQDLDLVTHPDVAQYWQQHFDIYTLEQNNDKTFEGNVVCFFHLCQAGELGTVTIGKRGQPARLRLERSELAAYLEGQSRAMHPPVSVVTLQDDKEMNAPTENQLSIPSDGQALAPTGKASTKSCLLISTAADAAIIDQVRTMLELFDLESREICRNASTSASTLFNDEVLQTLHECDAAVIFVGKGDCRVLESGVCQLDQNILTELGAAYALYGRRILLLLDEQLTLPPGLRGLPHFKFNGGDLTWEAGMTLMTAIKALNHGTLSNQANSNQTT